MQIDSRSVLLGNAQLLDPLGDDRRAVVWTRARLRMELRRARAQLRVVEPLDRAVVERDVCHALVVARRDGEAVVLGGHEHARSAAIEDGMVCAAGPERVLERLSTGRERQELVAEADA